LERGKEQEADTDMISFDQVVWFFGLGPTFLQPASPLPWGITLLPWRYHALSVALDIPDIIPKKTGTPSRGAGFTCHGLSQGRWSG
jgi:hypothetical protein